MIPFGEDSLRTAIHNFVAHYHTERNHQGLENRLIIPQAGYLVNAGPIQRRQRYAKFPRCPGRAAEIPACNPALLRAACPRRACRHQSRRPPTGTFRSRGASSSLAEGESPPGCESERIAEIVRL